MDNTKTTTTPKAYKATSPLGWGYGDTPEEAIATLIEHNPSEKRNRVTVRGITHNYANGVRSYIYDRDVEVGAIPKTYKITILVKSDEFDSSEILDAVHEEIDTGFLAEIDAEIDGDQASVEPVRAEVAR